MTPALAGGFFTTSATWEAHHVFIHLFIFHVRYSLVTHCDGREGRSKLGWKQLSGNTVAQTVKSLPAVPGTQVQTLSWENPLAESMTSHSSILA